MKITENILLAPFTTFRIGGPAGFFCRIKRERDIVEAVIFAKKNRKKILVVGGGSNILVPDHGFPGVVLKMEIGGINIIGESDDDIVVEVGAGVVWDRFVSWSVGKELYGIENLSFIPGTIGASPVQNIGAYGMEVSSAISSVRAFDTNKGDFVNFSNKDCKFSYRYSIFKKKKGRYIISKVTFTLHKHGKPNISYKDLNQYFHKQISTNKTDLLTPAIIRKAVVKIRRNKLPDWKHWCTAGSFFKNPIISPSKFRSLHKKYPELPHFKQEDGMYKIQLAWILDKVCGIKGKNDGKIGTYENQALVIVAKPGSSAKDVIKFARSIMRKVEQKTSIKIEGEVIWAV